MADEERDIRVLDIVSLYPAVFAMREFPTGYPIVFTDFTERQKETLPFRGLVKCKVLPPRNLKLPVLGVNLFQGLYFVNCKSCLSTKWKGRCYHEDENERALTGTWCTFELELALAKGYKVTFNTRNFI